MLLSKKAKAVLATIVLGVTSQMALAGTTHGNCLSLPGTWKGQAELKMLFLTCRYNSIASVHSGNSALAEVVFSKTSGSALCPKDGMHNVTVSCHDGRVEMKDTKIDVSGQLSEDNSSASLQGNFYALYKYHPFKLFVTKDS